MTSLTPSSDRDWWRTAVVYQVYPRSFADSDGDGIGDLAGLSSRLPYLADLGVDALWLSPFYPSPLADGGYDITDHQGVDPRLGTLADFDDVVRQAHGLGLKILVDIVPNHTSDQHPWFRAALAASAGSAARDKYIFREGTGPDGATPPTDWRSHFGGSAWERTDDGEWYCHLFAAEQPDLNWDHPEIRQYFLDTLRFWADRGADGFRVDVAHALAKDLGEPLRSQPHLDSRLPLDGTDPLYDRDEVHAIYREWRDLFNQYEPPRMGVAETWTPVTDRTFQYARPDELGQVFDFSLLKSEWDPDQFRGVIERSLTGHRAHGGGMTWVLSSHDVPRHASRLALPAGASPDAWLRTGGAAPAIDPRRGVRRARAATLMMLALPGSSYLFQGEELGLPEVADLPLSALRDPTFQRSGGEVKGRDGARVPIPWTRSGTSFGFGAHGSWLPQPAGFGELSVEAQNGVKGSTLELYRTALHLRKAETALRRHDLTWCAVAPGVLAFDRGAAFRLMVNFATSPASLPAGSTILISSEPVESAALPGESAAWLRMPTV